MSQAEAVPEVGRSGLFARTATGLVRGVPPRSSLILNFIPGHPTQTMAAVLLFALAVGPGGNPFLALLLVVPMTLAFSYAFGLLTQMIPRSGGDYMLVTRVIHPAIGWVSVFCMTTAGLLSNAFFGLLMFALAGVMQLWGWRWILRIQNFVFWMVTASLLLCGLMALILSKSH